MYCLELHPDNPQQRYLSRLVDTLRRGGIVAFPTDSAYALICGLDHKEPVELIRRIRQLDKNHNFSLFCKDLSHLSRFARVTNSQFRYLKAHLPGPYTFILDASKAVPRRLQHPKRKTIGLRVPNQPLIQALLEAEGDALMGVSLIMPGDDLPIYDAEQVQEKLSKQVDALVEGTVGSLEPTTVIDLCGPEPVLIRRGQGDWEGIL